jgi:predicted  nucleic acid-binding Zn-ribbon protein
MTTQRPANIFEQAHQHLAAIFTQLRAEVGRLDARAAELRGIVDKRTALRDEQAALETQIAKLRAELSRQKAALEGQIANEHQRLDRIRAEIATVLRAVRPKKAAAG